MFAIYTRYDSGKRISYEGVVLTSPEPKIDVQPELKRGGYSTP